MKKLKSLENFDQTPPVEKVKALQGGEDEETFVTRNGDVQRLMYTAVCTPTYVLKDGDQECIAYEGD